MLPRLFSFINLPSELSLPTTSPLPSSPQKSTVQASSPLQIHSLQGDYVSFYPKNTPTILSWTKWKSNSERILMEPLIYKFTDDMKEMGASLNIRTLPKAEAKVLGKANCNTIFIPIEIKGDWIRCHIPNNIVLTKENVSSEEDESEELDSELLCWVLTQQKGMILLDTDTAPDDMDMILVETALKAAEKAAEAVVIEEQEQEQKKENETETETGTVQPIVDQESSEVMHILRTHSNNKTNSSRNENSGSEKNTRMDEDDTSGSVVSSPSAKCTSRKSIEEKKKIAPIPANIITAATAAITATTATTATLATSTSTEKKEETVTTPGGSRISKHEWDERPISPLQDLSKYSTTLSPKQMKDTGTTSDGEEENDEVEGSEEKLGKKNCTCSGVCQKPAKYFCFPCFFTNN